MKCCSVRPTETFNRSLLTHSGFFQVSILSQLLPREFGRSAQVNFIDTEEILKNTESLQIDEIGNSNPESSSQIAFRSPAGYPGCQKHSYSGRKVQGHAKQSLLRTQGG